MKSIKKHKEPPSLTFYKKQVNANYKDYREKDDLRQTLLAEQGYICCYCMARISADKMRIEHWKPQSHPDLMKNPLLGLDYSNLLGACQGGEGGYKEQYHCDKSKEEKEISVHPNEAIGISCEALVYFRGDGSVYSNDGKIDWELNHILKLNLQSLVDARAATLETFRKIMGQRYSGTLKKQKLQEILEFWRSATNGKYQPYCRVVLAYLEKKIR